MNKFIGRYFCSSNLLDLAESLNLINYLYKALHGTIVDFHIFLSYIIYSKDEKILLLIFNFRYLLLHIYTEHLVIVSEYTPSKVRLYPEQIHFHN